MQMEMDKKSRFLPPLTTRDGLNYPKPGSWMRNVSFNKLATLAKNLDTSRSKNHPDKLHSIPTPWARLLLFESALYEKDHPAHAEVTNQWRGLLGLIGLAEVLGLSHKLTVPTFNLPAEAPGDLKNAFNVLKPQHVIGGQDLEQDKWNDFGLIYFDGALLGGTSPRTIVFTGISHQCPANIPFRSEQGRLSDPSQYYKRHDPQFLHVISQWLNYLIETVAGHNRLAAWLGEQPSDPNAQSESRHRQLLDALQLWRNDLGSNNSGAVVIPAGFSRLPAPYDFVKHIERIDNGGSEGSDLLLRTNNNVLVCYRPHHDSVILDPYGNKVTSQPLRIFGLHLVQPNQELPARLDFLPSHLKVINDPRDLFEDTLIEIDVIDSRSTLCLSLGKKNYLLPFKNSLTEFFNDAEAREILRNADVSQPDGATIRVKLTIPLVKGRSIVVHKDYRQEQHIISNDNLDLPTQELAMWPDFICPGEDKNGKPYFEHYFYYTNDQTVGSKRVQVEFTPLGKDLLLRTGRGKTWYMSRKPLLGFVGSVNNKQGLLLIDHTAATPPTTNWKVGVDFGSTHTTVFRREVEQRDGKWFGLKDSTIESVKLVPRVKILTVGDAAQIQEMFFLYRASEKEGVAEHAITTQLTMPVSDAEYRSDDWLPREGQVFLGSLLDTIPNNLHTDLKWNTDRTNFTTSSFLRSLLVMVEAEAIRSGAKIAHVSHAYPTAFPSGLKQKQIEGWQAVQRCVNVPVDREPLSEALAVCRHLWAEQHALPMANVVALDIGGSTTDIAVWSDGKLKMQESVKMAAGLAIKFIEGAPKYGEWFSEVMSKEEPFITSGINLQPPKKWNPRLYQAALKRLSEDGKLDSFIEAIKAAANTSNDVKFFLSPIVFLFAAVSYFAGLLTRKAGLAETGHFYLYFCGKGGQLIRWMPHGETLVSEMFQAGLWLSESETKRPGVTVKISEFPKQEVGRGLLIERELDANQNHEAAEMFAEPHATVTVAEDGFPGMAWNDKLTFEKLNQIINNIPSPDKLAQLNRFVKTFASLELTKRIAEDYDMKDFSSDLQFTHYLKQRLSDNLRYGKGGALVEPLFITETKILIERMTNQSRLFD
jgi:hypothetical protein